MRQPMEYLISDGIASCDDTFTLQVKIEITRDNNSNCSGANTLYTNLTGLS